LNLILEGVWPTTPTRQAYRGPTITPAVMEISKEWSYRGRSIRSCVTARIRRGASNSYPHILMKERSRFLLVNAMRGSWPRGEVQSLETLLILRSVLIAMAEAEPLSIRASIISSTTTWIHALAALRS